MWYNERTEIVKQAAEMLRSGVNDTSLFKVNSIQQVDRRPLTAITFSLYVKKNRHELPCQSNCIRLYQGGQKSEN